MFFCLLDIIVFLYIRFKLRIYAYHVLLKAINDLIV